MSRARRNAYRVIMFARIGEVSRHGGILPTAGLAGYCGGLADGKPTASAAARNGTFCWRMNRKVHLQCCF
ncbi:MAG: hypothetical protein K2N38_11955 [Oscillospiraceae bacterium]|nr:hypothetical protein [Oscillospiraceae bacterium]